MRCDTLRCCAILFVAVPCIAAAVDCASYAEQGYCTKESTKTYMARHCASHCDGAEGMAAAADGEDEACANWAAEGYCTNEEYKAYMASSCPSACGFRDDDDGIGRDAEVEAEDEEDEGEDDDDQMEDDNASDAASAASAASAAGRSVPASASADAEPEDCRAWARQGLCEGAHEEYMKLNCAKTCATVPAGGGAEGPAYDTFTCARWAMSGFCAEGHSHAPFMVRPAPQRHTPDCRACIFLTGLAAVRVCGVCGVCGVCVASAEDELCEGVRSGGEARPQRWCAAARRLLCAPIDRRLRRSCSLRGPVGHRGRC